MRGDPLQAGIAGTALLGLAGAATAVLIRRPVLRTPGRLSLLTVLMFIAGSALMTALGRLEFSPSQSVSSRYHTPALLFCAALSILLVSYWRTPARTWGRVGAAFGATTLVVCALAQRWAVVDALERSRSLAPLTMAMLAGVSDQAETQKAFFGDPDAQIARLRASRTSVFAQDWAAWLGTSLDDHVSPQSRFTCRGYLDEIRRVGDGHSWKATGWVIGDDSRRGRRDIIFTDREGIVIGYAAALWPREDVTSIYEQAHDLYPGFVGYFTTPGEAHVRAFLLSADHSRACAFDSDGATAVVS
jgi:hypothetical protein